MPGIHVWWWLRTSTPGGGPQGGLFAFLALFVLLGGLTLVGLGIIIRYVRTDPAVTRPVLMVLLWLILWALVTWKLSSWANTASLADATPDERTRARLAYGLLLLLSGLANLGLLARLRGLSGSP